MSAFKTIINISILLLFVYLQIFTPGCTPSRNEMELSDGPDTLKTWLALGDSYTIGVSVAESERFVEQTIELLKLKGIKFKGAEIIARNGWTTYNLWNAINSQTFAVPYDLVTLQIGVNDQYRGYPIDDYSIQITQLLNRCIELAGNDPTKVIVLSIPDYAATPFVKFDKQQTSANIDAYNKISIDICEPLRIKYISLNEVTRKAATDLSLLASDSLHYSGKGYRLWADLILEKLEIR